MKKTWQKTVKLAIAGGKSLASFANHYGRDSSGKTYRHTHGWDWLRSRDNLTKQPIMQFLNTKKD